MNKLIYLILILLITSFPVAAGQNSGYFTNEDLNKYKDSSDKNPAPSKEAGTPKNTVEDPLLNTFKDKADEEKLKKYVIPYGNTARRIIIPVTFNRRITVPMLLDTGAPGMHISARLAAKLGILDNDEGNLLTWVGGIAGTAPAILTIIDSIQVGEAEDEFIPTIISDLNVPGFEGLVGMDFMGKYSMQLDNKRRRVILQEMPESPLRPAGHDELWWRTTFLRFKSMKDAWEKYGDKNKTVGAKTTRQKRVKAYIDRQCGRADYLYNRLKVYASEHSVPLEWR